ncbi:MAG TPA: UpxY family transcription antiterminator [Candidatus Sulfotelmatobacter sp.]|jgi:transcription antitermination factor NusG|nr:UpxY family transcription antiterminator [Candidatus Sulfotelmatobacter sp.]
MALSGLPVDLSGMTNHLHWYAVRTRSRHEKLVARQLLNQGITAFLPVVTKINQWSDRKKQVEEALFAGYAFVRLDHSSNDRIRVLRTQGVVNFVGVQGTGVPIPDQEIENITTLLASRVSYQEQPYLHVGQRVRVCGGALDGLEGILTAENSDRSVVISIGLIQRSLSVRVAGYNVEPL